MNDAIGGASARPDQQKDVLARRGGPDFTDKLVSAGYGMAVDLNDDVAGSEAGIFGGAGRPYAFDSRSVHLFRDVELLTEIVVEVAYRDAQLALLRAVSAVVGGELGLGMILADLHVHGFVFAVAEHVEGDAGSRLDLAHCDLQGAA